MRTTLKFAGVVLLVTSAALSLELQAQERPGAMSVRREDALRLLIDCGDPACEMDFIRREIDFVNYVRTRQDAQVYILVATQPTTAGGTEYTLSFIGQQQFAGQDDELRYVSEPNETPAVVRRDLVGLLKRGLVRYVNRTPFGERLVVSYTAPDTTATAAAPVRDPWNFWTFSTTLTGFVDGEESSRSTSLSGSVSANRTTDMWKIATTLQVRYSESELDLGDGESITNIQRNHALGGLVVKSLGNHLSAGLRGALATSVFLNQDVALRLGPAVEYSLYPYSESTRRQLTVEYSIGGSHFDYVEETIFGEITETLMDHRLLASLRLRQPWGSITTSVEGSHYLHNAKRQRAIGVSSIDVNLFKGFSLVTFGGVELIRDQLYLPKRGASLEEILLRQRQLATSFRFWASVGFSYNFGSPFANVVNPRFMGSAGGTTVLR